MLLRLHHRSEVFGLVAEEEEGGIPWEVGSNYSFKTCLDGYHPVDAALSRMLEIRFNFRMLYCDLEAANACMHRYASIRVVHHTAKTLERSARESITNAAHPQRPGSTGTTGAAHPSAEQALPRCAAKRAALFGSYHSSG